MVSAFDIGSDGQRTSKLAPSDTNPSRLLLLTLFVVGAGGMLLYSLAAPSQTHTVSGLVGLRGTMYSMDFDNEYSDELGDDLPVQVRRGQAGPKVKTQGTYSPRAEDGAKAKRQRRAIKRAGQQRLMQTLEAVNKNAEDEYDEAVQRELEDDFPAVPPDVIEATLEDNGYSYELAYEDLSQVVETKSAAPKGKTCAESSDADLAAQAQLNELFPDFSEEFIRQTLREAGNDFDQAFEDLQDFEKDLDQANEDIEETSAFGTQQNSTEEVEQETSASELDDERIVAQLQLQEDFPELPVEVIRDALRAANYDFEKAEKAIVREEIAAMQRQLEETYPSVSPRVIAKALKETDYDYERADQIIDEEANYLLDLAYDSA